MPKVFDFAIHGAGRIASRAGRGLTLGVEGSLYWGGHDWLGGFLEASTTTLKAGGRTSFAFPLTHPGTGNLQFANLYCRVAVGGSFEIDTDRGLASWRADASCMVGLRLPAPSNQFIPLASFKAADHGSTNMRLRILSFKGFEIPGLSDIEFDLPKVVSNGSIDVDVVRVGAANILEFRVPYLDGTPGPKPKDWLGFISRRDLLEIPLLSLDGTETINLGKLVSNKTEVFLTFVKGALVLEVVSGGETIQITLVDV